MDQSYWSSQKIIDASRDFVCIRMATYESAEEGKILESIFSGRSGKLENTVFAMLDPTAKKFLVRAGRSPGFAFSGGEQIAIAAMASKMRELAKQYPMKENVESADAALPYIADLRLAVNITACDNLPLVVVAGDEQQRRQMEEKLKPLVWKPPFIGQFSFVAVDLPELKWIDNCKSQAGIVIVQPDRFGVQGTRIEQIPADATTEEITAALKTGLRKFEKFEKIAREQIAAGQRERINWETAIPVTDPGRPPGPGGPKGGPPRGP